MELLVVDLQALQDLDRVFDGGFVDVDLLEPANQRAVLLEVLAELLVGRGAHAPQGARGERGLQQVGGVHGPARGGARADHRVDLVDEQHRVRVVLEFLDHLLHALFEVTPIAGASQQRAHVEREDRRAGQDLGDLVVDDLARQALGDGGLADTGVADQQRVILRAPAKDLDAALHLGRAADQRVDLTLLGLFVEVDAVGFQGLAAGLDGGLVLVVRGALHGLGLGGAGFLGDAVGDVVHRVVAGHVLLLQEVGGVALAFREDRHQHIGAGDFLAARGLHVDHRALDHALEAGGGFGVLAIVHHERAQFGVHIVGEGGAKGAEVDVAGAHHPRGFLVVDEGQEQMLQGCVLVLTLVGVGYGAMKGLFEGARK